MSFIEPRLFTISSRDSGGQITMRIWTKLSFIDILFDYGPISFGSDHATVRCISVADIIYVNGTNTGCRRNQNSSVNNNIFMAIIIHSFIVKVSKLHWLVPKFKNLFISLNPTILSASVPLASRSGRNGSRGCHPLLTPELRIRPSEPLLHNLMCTRVQKGSLCQVNCLESGL